MLTGTPLQNDLVELHNLLSFLLPGLFKDSQENEDQNFGELRSCLTGSVLWCWVVQNAGRGFVNLFLGSALRRGAGLHLYEALFGQPVRPTAAGVALVRCQRAQLFVWAVLSCR